MICDKTIRDGTNQLERISEHLREGFVKIDERTPEDLMRLVYDFADKLAYYDPNNNPTGSWQAVLGEISDLQDFIVDAEQDKPPHIGLLMALVQLYGYAQDEINTITRRHLDYYYRTVLKIQAKKAIPDEVQLVLELAKSNAFDQYVLKANTAFDGGMDVEKNPLIYETDQEAIISRAAVRQIKTLYLDKGEGHTRIVMAPIADSLDGIGEPLDENAPYWATFGESQTGRGVEERTMVDAAVGFAICSSILVLREGNRTIGLDIDFFPNADFSGPTSLQNALDIYYSGTEAWEEPSFFTAALVNTVPAENLWQLQLRITIDASRPALDFFNPDIFQEAYPTQSPILKVILRPEEGGYDALKQLRVNTVDISVEVNGMKNHLIQNNSGVLNPEGPFLPFGPQPVLNSRFYIGNKEIFQKKLNHLSITLDWHDIPDSNFANHYSEYDLPIGFGNTSFDVRIDLLLNKSWEHRLKAPEPLFDGIDATVAKTIDIAQVDFDLATTGVEYIDEPTTDAIQPLGVHTNRGFIRIELITPTGSFRAFGHKEFVPLYTERAIALATHTPPSPVPVLPNQPYTPSLKELRMGYRSQKTLQSISQTKDDAMFQIGPFGFRQIDTSYNSELVPLMTEEGSMIVGFDGFSPPQALNLLFELEEGTANRSLLLEPENIAWHYLSEDRWIQLSPQEILADGTKGFKRSGIISLILPKDASDTNYYLPSGMFWIKATASLAAEGANKLKNIFSNAVNATLRLAQENYDSHLESPLPANSISSLANRVKEIKRVTQPLRSNKGYSSETPSFYNARISERLRHKKRAVQFWDYERIVLEAFPDIFKVKCLSNTDPDSEVQAGSITLIIISDLRNKDTSNPFEPSTSILILEEVKEFIRQYISPFVSVFIEQPLYESILVDAKIGFMPGFDPGFYSNRLNEELKQFLSPWAFAEGIDIEIGGAIYKSSILHFMETRPYVDFVVDFKIYHKQGGAFEEGISEMEIDLDFEVAPSLDIIGIGDMGIGVNYIVGKDVVVACATSSRSILVSAIDHRITALRPEEYKCPGTASLGIGFMTIDTDLMVGQ